MTKANIIKFIKQLLCKHVYKDNDTELLSSKTVVIHDGSLVEIHHYDVLAIHRACIKCEANKIRLTEKLKHKVNISDVVEYWEAKS